MGGLDIYTVVNSRYNVFDQSGKLPFSVVFGLCRRSKKDTDPRSLRLSTANSLLDVPYALRHELLRIYVKDPQTRTERSLELGQSFGQTDSTKESYLTLPSPVGRTGNWRHHLSVYQYHIDPSSELAKLFEAGKQYYIRITKNVDIGGTGHIYLDQEICSEVAGPPSDIGEKLKLISSGGHGRAGILATPSLSWPPNLLTQLRRHCSEGNENATLLEITVINTSAETITVQTRGRQRYLFTWGPMSTIPFPEPLSCLIDSKSPSPGSHIQIIDAVTKKIVRAANTAPYCLVHSYKNYDPRPKGEALVTLRPGEPLVKQVDVGKLLSRLPDGRYYLQMEPQSLWWCIGDCEEFAPNDEDRVPHDLYKTKIPPLMLECNDYVELQVENGVAK